MAIGGGSDTESWKAIEEILRGVDDRVRIVRGHVMRRIIRHEQRIGMLDLRIAHRESMTIRVSDALRAATAEELDLRDSPRPSDWIILLAEPRCRLTREAASAWGWRRLFHARIHEEMASRADRAGLGGASLRERIDRIGHHEFEEARAVLDRDGWLFAPSDDLATYQEFAAVLLELNHFAPTLLRAHFPGIANFEDVAEVLRLDVDDEEVMRATRPAGAEIPGPHPPIEPPVPRASVSEDHEPRSEARYRWLIARAERARRAGNLVRSAAIRFRASRIVGSMRAGQARSGASDDLDRLHARLIDLFDSLGVDASRLRPSLTSIAERTGRTFWSPRDRILYDLQSACEDHEREVYGMDLVAWLTSFGRRDLKQPLPHQRPIRILRHLRRAATRLPALDLGLAGSDGLGQALHEAIEGAEHIVRGHFRPLLREAFVRAGFRPGNLPEEVSFDRTVEELIDVLVARGHMTMGDVRDASARGDIRQPDRLAFDLWRGDRVLKVNQALKRSMKGVYRPGEVYLRFIQSASYSWFGTKAGRFVARYVALPFGGAFGALVTAHELLGLVGVHADLVRWEFVAALGTFFLLLLHNAKFREWVVSVGSQGWRGLRWLAIDLPATLYRVRWVRAVLRSAWFDVLRRLVLLPLSAALGAFVGILAFESDRAVASTIAALVFVAVSFFLGTPLGRELEGSATDFLAGTWRRIRVDFIPGVLRLMVDAFKTFLEGVERVLYEVDEALRYRSGQGAASLWAKAVFGLVWGVVAYTIRIYVNLLVEPTVNPVKHFPTVTVAAKVIIPVLKPMTVAIATAVGFLGEFPAYAFAGATVLFLPGLAGFIVWELKENWKLFEANRPRTLRPRAVGHHGESMRRLLRPGFHSGTIPKLFTRLRGAERGAFRTGDRRAAEKAHDGLHHVRTAICRFLERNMVALLEKSERFRGDRPTIGRLDLATNKVEIDLSAGAASSLASVAFVVEGPLVLGEIVEPTRVASLEPVQRDALEMALRGLFALGGVDWMDGDAVAESVTWADWVAFWERNRDRAEQLESQSAT